MESSSGFEKNIEEALHLHRSGDENAAIPHYLRAICQKPNDPTALSLFPLAAPNLIDLKTVRFGRRATWIDPKSAVFRTNFANQLCCLLEETQAFRQYSAALSLDPSLADSYYNFAVLETNQGSHAKALKSYQRCLTIRPDWLQAKSNLAFALLALGRYLEAWPLYETRFSYPGYLNWPISDLPYPGWDGRESLCGRRILLWAEQGLGDTIQFFRFAKTLASREKTRVGLLVRPPLAELLKQQGFSAHTQPPERREYDFHFPLMSVPNAMGVSLGNIPFAQSPYLFANERSRQKWLARIPKKKSPLIGLVWRTGTASKITGRSIPLSELIPLSTRGLITVCLQKEITSAERDLVRKLAPSFYIPQEEQVDFSDTAGIIAALDLVISVDTSVAHLAAAMGKPTWVLLPKVSDWRWLTDRADSPWYPNVRLFRQEIAGEWSHPVTQIVEQLRKIGYLESPNASLPALESRAPPEKGD